MASTSYVRAYAAASVLTVMAGSMRAPSVAANLSAMALAALAAIALAGTLGLFFERVVIRPVYGIPFGIVGNLRRRAEGAGSGSA